MEILFVVRSNRILVSVKLEVWGIYIGGVWYISRLAKHEV
jgi:hypothetical protein